MRIPCATGWRGFQRTAWTASGILLAPDAGEADGKRIAAIMDLSIERNSTDVMTVRDDTRDAAGTEYGTGHVRRLMRRHGLSRRKVQNVRASHAAPSSLYSWQRYLENMRIPCLKNDGFTCVI